MSISFRSKDFLVSEFTVTPKGIDAHIHKYYEFLHFAAGDAVYLVNGNTYALSPGDIIVTKPEILHAISFNSSSDYSRAFIQLSPNMLSRIPQKLVQNIIRNFKNDICVIPKKIAKTHGLYDYYDTVIDLLSKSLDTKTVYMAELELYKFAVSVNEALRDNMHNQKSESENATLSKVKSYIDENYITTLNLDELAESMFVSKYYICHLFKEQLGITVLDYIALKRITAIKELIAKDLNITDAYRRCGFNDYSSFYRAVKKYTGLKPSEFYK